MRIIQCVQGSEEWFAARLNKVTASHFAVVMAKGRGGTASKTRDDYLYTLVAERRNGKREPTYQSKEMQEGTEREPGAREWYEWLYNDVEQVGFVEMTDDVGCSPDGLVGDDGLLEIKCPKPKTHYEYIDKYLRRGLIPPCYKAQVQGQIWVCERQWCDFATYHPDGNPNIAVVRVDRDDTYISLLSAAVATFLQDLTELEKRLEKAA